MLDNAIITAAVQQQSHHLTLSVWGNFSERVVNRWNKLHQETVDHTTIMDLKELWIKWGKYRCLHGPNVHQVLLVSSLPDVSFRSLVWPHQANKWQHIILRIRNPTSVLIKGFLFAITIDITQMSILIYPTSQHIPVINSNQLAKRNPRSIDVKCF